MPRLVDLIRRGKMHPPPGYTQGEAAVTKMHRDSRNMLAHAQIFSIDNVAEYFYAGNDQEIWHEREDFPNVAPPFPVFWMEWKRPSVIVSKVHGLTKTDGQADVTGVLMRVAKVESQNEAVNLLRHWFRNYGPIAAEARLESSIQFLTRDRSAPPRWVFHASVFIQDSRLYADGLPIGPTFEYMNTIDAEGRLTGGPSMLIPIPQEIVDEHGGHHYSGTMFPVFMALSLLHCKNVHTQDHVTPAKLARSIEKKHGVPPVSYKTLAIEPMTRQIVKPKNGGDTGRQMGLHIMRGGFRTYTEERPLFGKHAGTWWWDSFLRGDAKAGVVEKDYQVQAPRGQL